MLIHILKKDEKERTEKKLQSALNSYVVALRKSSKLLYTDIPSILQLIPLSFPFFTKGMKKLFNPQLLKI